ncbi:MAG: kynureninase [Phycisphaeraceae bacterium]|nr:kynureninase [Phycisphaerales bacterium]MCB9860862.1 kynureninase [Phycisphaeraceae bacterium]
MTDSTTASPAHTAWDALAFEARATKLDRDDPLATCRDQFYIPKSKADPSRDAAYFVGNSLGLQPKAARAEIEQELDDWARLGVDAHFHGKVPWFSTHEAFREIGARLVGANPGEVVMMNSLTVNLHLMMASFYRPTSDRYKIVIEDTAFPSDSYAVQSQTALHGFDPHQAILRLKPRDGEHTLRTEDVVETIGREGKSIALVMLAGVNYLTGQFMDIDAITAAARDAGCNVGWDCAHAAGNLPLKLHELGPDFACWCSYKYLNSGPGAVAGCFVHERHSERTDLPRLAGWWGNKADTRFLMRPDFVPSAGADAWQLSNPPVMALAPMRASLKIFDEVGMEALRAKSLKMTGLLAEMLGTLSGNGLRILTPSDPAQRGCQLSLDVSSRGSTEARRVFEGLEAAGIVCDYREPGVIRAAPVPLYNTYGDTFTFASTMQRLLGR